MVAVAVFAVAGAALIKNASLAVNQTMSIRDKTLAYWIAKNEISQIRSVPRDPQKFVSTGTDRHTVTMADREWQVVIEVAATENDAMRRVEIGVYREDDLDNAAALLTSFVGRH
jgi:general secretion pathway protein I